MSDLLALLVGLAVAGLIVWGLLLLAPAMLALWVFGLLVAAVAK